MDSASTPLLAQLLEIASRYAARPAQASDRIYADLDINGSDFIEFVEEVEGRYGVDLEWVSPTERGGDAADPTLQALATDVLRQRG